MSEFASTSSGNPLLAALSAEQVALLVTIARPVIAAQYSGGTSTWPAWAYVAEQFEDENSGSDALVVWRSLPTVPGLNDGITGVPGRRPYGLVWRGDNHTIDPTYEERVGLSIAGFYQLQRHNRAPLVAKALLLVLSALAEWEAKTVRADVTGPGTKDVALDEYTSWFSTAHREKPYVIMAEVVGQCLRYEYFLISMLENQSGWSVRLGARQLRPYLDLGGDVAAYLRNVVDSAGAAAAPKEQPTTETPAPRLAPVRRLSFDNFHPRVQAAAGELFADGHFASAISEAFKSIEVRVKKATGIDQSGAKLMASAFHPTDPPLDVATEAGQSGKDEREGFQALFRGAMIGIRNPRAHELFKAEDPQTALEYLGFASLLHRRIDHAEQDAPTTTENI